MSLEDGSLIRLPSNTGLMPLHGLSWFAIFQMANQPMMLEPHAADWLMKCWCWNVAGVLLRNLSPVWGSGQSTWRQCFLVMVWWYHTVWYYRVQYCIPCTGTVSLTMSGYHIICMVLLQYHNQCMCVCVQFMYFTRWQKISNQHVTISLTLQNWTQRS